MAAADIDDYLAGLSERDRDALADLRSMILDVVPDAEECISYGMPAFRVRGKVVAGFAAFTDHLSYLPHSGSVLPALATELDGYEGTKGSLHFTAEKALAPELVDLLIRTRLVQAGLGG